MGQLGHFEIIREIGRGAMGVVYLAQDLVIGRKVAIKTIEVSNVEQSGQASLEHALLEEARLAGNLAHPNIVTIYQIGKQEKLLFLVMEFVAGGSLDSRLQPGRPAAVDWSLAVLRQVASALDAAHAAHVVHRDIKPSNILINLGDDQVKVADFGLARVFASGRSQSMVAGTPNFMSPEQVEGRPLDGRSDQFALAILAYLLLTGRLPFVGDSMMALAFQIVTATPALAHVANGALPAGVSEVISRGLEKQRERRYPSCVAFVQALESAFVAPAPVPRPSRAIRWPVFAAGAVGALALAVTYLAVGRLREAPKAAPRAAVISVPEPVARKESTAPTVSVIPEKASPKATQKPVAEPPPPVVVSDAVRQASGALQIAVRDGAPLAEVEALIAAGASLRGDSSSTPLYTAVLSCREDLARLLLARGADPNVRPAYGFVALVGALKSERYGKPCPSRAELVSLLLASGARPEAEDSSAAVTAAAGGPDSLPFLRLLLDRGAKAQSALPSAVFAARTYREGVGDCNPAAVALLLSRGATPDGGKEPLLQKAVSVSCVEVLQLLLKQGAKVDRPDEEGRTALFVLASQRFGGQRAIAMAQALLRAGADPNRHSRADRTDFSAGATPLLMAATGELEMFSLLLENKGDPNQVDAAGQTCLHLAVRGRREKTVKFLLAAGARNNIRDRDGRTPLGVARYNGFQATEAVVKMLLAANAPE